MRFCLPVAGSTASAEVASAKAAEASSAPAKSSTSAKATTSAEAATPENNRRYPAAATAASATAPAPACIHKIQNQDNQQQHENKAGGTIAG